MYNICHGHLSHYPPQTSVCALCVRACVKEGADGQDSVWEIKVKWPARVWVFTCLTPVCGRWRGVRERERECVLEVGLDDLMIIISHFPSSPCFTEGSRADFLKLTQTTGFSAHDYFMKWKLKKLPGHEPCWYLIVLGHSSDTRQHNIPAHRGLT